MKSVAIIIINWNNANDTLECIFSLLEKLQYQYYRIFLIDNSSQDDSVKQIIESFEQKNIPFQRYMDSVNINPKDSQDIVFIESNKNLGFAGGNNFVMRIAYNLGYQFFWLLNNDTILKEDSLTPLVKVMESDSSVGFTGSVLIDYYSGRIQSYGAQIRPLLGITTLNFKDGDPTYNYSKTAVKSDYQNGASLLVSRSVIEKSGYLDEFFFMYFEETDWQIRARKAGLRNELVFDSRVIHKGSVSTNNKRYLFYYYYTRSAALFLKRHFPFHLILALPSLSIITLIRTKFNYKSVKYALKGMFDGIMNRPIS